LNIVSGAFRLGTTSDTSLGETLGRDLGLWEWRWGGDSLKMEVFKFSKQVFPQGFKETANLNGLGLGG